MPDTRNIVIQIQKNLVNDSNLGGIMIKHEATLQFSRILSVHINYTYDVTLFKYHFFQIFNFVLMVRLLASNQQHCKRVCCSFASIIVSGGVGTKHDFGPKRPKLLTYLEL